MTCANCRKTEYLTRDYCRCGHYLGGQLEDEYIAWEQQLYSAHCSLSERTESKLRPFRYIVLLGLPFLVVPLAQMAFLAERVSVATLFWMAPALVIFGVFAIIERFLTRPLQRSAMFIENHTFADFFDQKHQIKSAMDAGSDDKWTVTTNSHTTEI